MIRTVISIFLFLGCTFLGNPIATTAQTADSLDLKIGEMLMVGFRGLSVSDTSSIVRDIKKYHLGGVILYDYDIPSDSPVRNIQSAGQITELTTDLQRYADDRLFISIDQEGGKVVRLKKKFGFDPALSAAKLGEIDDIDTTRKYARETAQTLEQLGINMNFAPVVDLNTNPQNPVIGQLDRSYGAEPGLVGRHAAAVIETYAQYDILSAIKHFPGHGSAWNDSHEGMADVTDTWQPIELEPYRQLIRQHSVDMIMTAHIYNARLDSVYPATMSEPIITGLLRDSLQFDGVVISDDMQMKAIRSFYGLETAIQRSIEAGVDILLFSNNSIFDPDIASKAHGIIRSLVKSGEISRERINRSFRRIKQLKQTLN